MDDLVATTAVDHPVTNTTFRGMGASRSGALPVPAVSGS
jgi:hypothetical protein